MLSIHSSQDIALTYLFRVFQAYNPSEGKKCALKVMTKCDSDEFIEYKKVLENEYNVLSELDHPSIIKTFGYSENERILNNSDSIQEIGYISLEYFEKGTLFDLICEKGELSEDLARIYFLELLEAVEYMHQCGYSHTDLKLENIMIDEQFHIKLIDFGFATKEKYWDNITGTMEYLPPEALDGKTK
jgi:serine/threonine protein kinase